MDEDFGLFLHFVFLFYFDLFEDVDTFYLAYVIFLIKLEKLVIKKINLTTTGILVRLASDPPYSERLFKIICILP